ncbi:MAG: RNA 2',3'-cyclic phosphodiesterase [Hyphomicrobiales bacterium]|nr:RNA 2',3'-cyclic phosphodiesterase [Hyphomicrobiales bacterium]
MYRLFVGLRLADHTRALLESMRSGLPGAKWVDVEDTHITLRFIGEVDGGAAEDLHAALSRIRAPSFALALASVDCFASSGKVHTVFVGVDKEPWLAHLREKVESAVVRTGFPPERRKFRPHVTLARFKTGAGDRLGSYLHRYSQFRAEPFEVGQFTLFRSHLTAKGAHYETVAEYDLEKGRRLLSPGLDGAPASAFEP